MLSARSHRRVMPLLVFLVAIFVLAHVPAAEAVCGGTPAVTTDKPDYGPTETVTISGTDLGCGEVLSVLVTAPDGSTRSGDGTASAGPDSVIVDENGGFSLSYHLSGTLPGGGTYEGQLGLYLVEVSDGSGTVVASTRFGDAQGYFSCALTTAGGVRCWGYNGYGSLGNGTFDYSYPYGSATPVDVSGLTSGVVQISVGYLHACALTTSGGVKCWGYNFYGGLGNGTSTPFFPYGVATPVDVTGLTSGVAQISAGTYDTCAVMVSGGAKCWGWNGYGQLGNGSFADSSTPVNVTGLASGVAQISMGYWNACAVTTSGGAKCWGYGGYGTVGDGTFLSRNTPVDVTGMTSGVAQIRASIYTTCAVTTGGGAKCWGFGGYGSVGDGTFFTRNVPVDVSGLTSGVAQIGVGWYHTCALTTLGGAKCWGFNYLGGVGDGSANTYRTTPVDVSGLTSGVAQVSLGFYHTCALTTSGGAKCWGYNGDGQVGDGTFFFYRTMPVDVSGLTSGVAQLWDGAGAVINQPPTVDAGGPYGGSEGSPIAMNGATATDPTDPLTYVWTVNSPLCSFSNDALLNPTLTCTDNGSFTATLSVDDGVNPAVESDTSVVVTNANPTASLVNNGPVNEGSSAAISFSAASDVSSTDTTAGFRYAFACNGGSLTAATYATSGTSSSTNCAFADNGSYTVRGKIMDKDDGSNEYTTVVTVNNVKPTITVLTPGAPAACGQSQSVTIAFNDPAAANDTYTVVVNWGDGNTTTYNGVNSGYFASHPYAAGGQYTVSVTVADEDGGTSDASTAVLTQNYTIVGGGILQPINQDGSSVFKYKSTIPVKIKVADCNGSFLGNLTVRIALTQLSGNDPGSAINEPISTSGADTTGFLRFTGAPDNQYIYNLASKPLPDPSATYRITLTIEQTGQTVQVNFGLKP